MTHADSIDLPKAAVDGHGGEMRLHATSKIEGSELILKMSGQILDRPTRYSVQIGIDRHIVSRGADPGVPGNAYRYINHSCAPNARVKHLCLIAVRTICPGEQITFDYDANEWDMASPFRCACGTPACRGLIRGYRHLGPAERKQIEPWLSSHLSSLREL
nr:SET domain-containing protein-lysine N-methyltransferase [uncultured Rhodopila sp.]